MYLPYTSYLSQYLYITQLISIYNTIARYIYVVRDDACERYDTYVKCRR